MFCTKCGKEILDGSVYCPHCGDRQGGTIYCQNCGQPASPGAMVCVKCGHRLARPVPAAGAKSKLAAGLLGIFLGGFGVHRFYLGYVGIGVIQIVVTLVTCGVGSLWGFIEGILILAGNMNTDAQGNPLTD